MRKLIGAVMGLAVLGIAGTFALSRCGGEEVPAPLWSRSDLPPLDQSDDNGWIALANVAVGRLDVDPPADADVAVTMLEHDGQAEFTEHLATARPALDAMMADPKAQAALQAWHAAVQAPSFSDGCRIQVGMTCPHFQLFRLSKLATAELLWRLARGDEEGAIDGLAAMVQVQHKYRTSSRSLMAAISSTAALKRSVAFAALLVSVSEDKDAEAARARLRLRKALDTVGRDDAVEKRALIGEYLMADEYLRALGEGGSELVEDEGWAPRWMFDEAWTRTRVDRNFKAAMDALDNGSPMPEQAEAPSWSESLTHPIGAPMVLVLDPALSANPHLDALRRDREELARRCDELLVRKW